MPHDHCVNYEVVPDCRRCITGERIRELEGSIRRLHDLLDAEHAARLGRKPRKPAERPAFS